VGLGGEESVAPIRAEVGGRGGGEKERDRSGHLSSAFLVNTYARNLNSILGPHASGGEGWEGTHI